jgi:hypothetical protein
MWQPGSVAPGTILPLVITLGLMGNFPRISSPLLHPYNAMLKDHFADPVTPEDEYYDHRR